MTESENRIFKIISHFDATTGQHVSASTYNATFFPLLRCLFRCGIEDIATNSMLETRIMVISSNPTDSVTKLVMP